MITGARMRIAAVALLLAILAFAAPSMRAQQGAAEKTAGEAFKNVQLLKDIPADDLQPTMRFFTYSLNVRCNFCHAQGDFASDDKEEKKTARAMISMVMAINKDDFRSRTAVTCYTCHRGANEPTPIEPGESTQIVPGGTPPAPEAAQGRGGAGRGGEVEAARPAAAARPEVDAILAKYVEALGGEQALRKITNRTMTGERDTAPRNGMDEPWEKETFEWYQKAPNLTVMMVHGAKGETTATGYDGSSFWEQNARGVVARVGGPALDLVKDRANFYEPLELKQQFTRMTVRGPQKIDGKDAYVVIANPAQGSQVRFYFDTQSGLLLRRVVRFQNPVASVPLTTDYMDYREANGVKYPSTIKTANVADNPVYTVLTIKSVDFSTPVDASKFTKPASRPQAGRGGRGGAGR
jgi:hypothetical protein